MWKIWLLPREVGVKVDKADTDTHGRGFESYIDSKAEAAEMEQCLFGGGKLHEFCSIVVDICEGKPWISFHSDFAYQVFWKASACTSSMYFIR